MIEDENPHQRGQQLYRLAWKFRKSGATGTGPWMQNRERVEAWLETFSRRYQDVEHWVESHNPELRVREEAGSIPE